MIFKHTKLWFDVGIKRYTTASVAEELGTSCGLMQESKDIQLRLKAEGEAHSCGLMQESKDIQHAEKFKLMNDVVV